MECRCPAHSSLLCDSEECANGYTSVYLSGECVCVFNWSVCLIFERCVYLFLMMSVHWSKWSGLLMLVLLVLNLSGVCVNLS